MKYLHNLNKNQVKCKPLMHKLNKLKRELMKKSKIVFKSQNILKERCLKWNSLELFMMLIIFTKIHFKNNKLSIIWFFWSLKRLFELMMSIYLKYSIFLSHYNLLIKWIKVCAYKLTIRTIQWWINKATIVSKASKLKKMKNKISLKRNGRKKR